MFVRTKISVFLPSMTSITNKIMRIINNPDYRTYSLIHYEKCKVDNDLYFF